MHQSFPEIQSTWPTFLDSLDRSPSKALEELYHFARDLFRARPPALLRSLSLADREDALHDVVCHCAADGFRVLRTYRNSGKPFRSWLRRIAENKVLDQLRRRGREPSWGDPLRDDQVSESRAEDSRPDARIDHQRALTATIECLGRLDRESQILIHASAEGLRPREITRLLGWPRECNRQVSDKCRYARQKLKRMLREQGLDLPLGAGR